MNTYTCKAPIKPLPKSSHLLASPRAEVSVKPNSCQEKPEVFLISVAAYTCACRTKGSMAFQLTTRNLGILCNHLTRVGKTESDMSQVPIDYHEFVDVFSKRQAKQLSSHCPHDLIIHIEDSLTPLLGPIYSLSSMELCTLQDFIEENIKVSLI